MPDPRLSTLPLDLRARRAWTLALVVRHEPNWGGMLQAASQLDRQRDDPNPRIRRLVATTRTGAEPPRGPLAA